MDDLNDPRIVLGAHRVVLKDVAQWRHAALQDHEEF